MPESDLFERVDSGIPQLRARNADQLNRPAGAIEQRVRTTGLRLVGTVREKMDEPRADEITALGLATEPPSRWSVAAGGLDVFWPILAVILTIAVIFVAVVARSSMEDVGAPAATVSRSTPAATSSALPSTIMIVQVSSHPTKAKAETAAAGLTRRGFTVQILKSGDYRPLNSGFYVVFVGPFPATDAGRSEAKKIQVRLTGSLVRTIHHR
jgi:hypothetical protein